MSNAIERWYSLKAVMELLGVSRKRQNNLGVTLSLSLLTLKTDKT